MTALQKDRTTVAMRVCTRDRLSRLAKTENSTIDALLNQILDEHDEKQFWAAMELTDAEEYRAAMTEDGTWPGDADYVAEATHE
ncbi:MAG: hypothetical protein LBH13_00620 [Cellulomonadaceae bacterium]|jgi:hypothetical protein|nr:hypothetical protein [Cellulomonadaceae bacterium]